MVERPTGAVTFLFTDIEGSTLAWETRPDEITADLEVHDSVLRQAIESHGGFVFATAGDSFSAAFTSPSDALRAAVKAQRSLAESECTLRVRMGAHSGEAVERDGDYFGPALNRTARLMSVGHGGQILASSIVRELVSSSEFEFVDLGEHRLADLSAATRITQLVADGLHTSFPPLRSAVATDNLPRLGEVFGRQTDIERLTELLVDKQLVTLTGAGGIGKTTLATSVANQMVEQFPDGRWMVDLTDLPRGSDQSAVVGAVAGVDDRFGSINALAPRRMLLVLDNCEHVLDGTRGYLIEVLAAAPWVTVLATSREALGIREEKVIPVAPLSIDEGSETASAVDLFVTRAEDAGVALDIQADRQTISAICGKVGGLPLAIELAAARTAVMTPHQILDRLSDRLSMLRGGQGGPEHHKTIEATIAWSYDLLDPDTQKLLRFLSVFEGGFDLDQAEAVGGTDAVDRLTDLVRKSLVPRHGDRFAMFEAIRQYANVRLYESSEGDEARGRHFEYFADWAHDVYHRHETIDLTNTDHQWITDNLANLLMAVRHGAERNEPTRVAEIATVLWPHRVDVLYDRWDYQDWFEVLLDHLDELAPQLQMGVLHGCGTISMQANDLDRATELLQAEYDIHRQTGQFSKTGGGPHNNLAIVAELRGQWDEAERLYREGIEVHKKNQYPHHNISGNLARLVWLVRDDASQALDIIRDARALDHLNTPLGLAMARLREADILIKTGDYHQARDLVTESLSYLRQNNVRLDHRVWALEVLSIIAYETGDMSLSTTLLLETLDTQMSEGFKRTWDERPAVHLARVLLDKGAAHTARRVLNEYRAEVEHIQPVELRRLQEQEARLESFRTDSAVDDDLPLIDAVRQALTGPPANPQD